MIVAAVYLFDEEQDLKTTNGPTKEDLGEDLFAFMIYSEKTFAILQLVIGILTLSLNGYWVLGSSILVGLEMFAVSPEVLNQLIDTCGLFVTTLNLFFTLMKFGFIDISVTSLMEFETLEMFHW
jgi:hypothetical protein